MLSELKKTQLTVQSVEEQNTQSLFCMCLDFKIRLCFWYFVQ